MEADNLSRWQKLLFVQLASECLVDFSNSFAKMAINPDVPSDVLDAMIICMGEMAKSISDLSEILEATQRESN